MKEVDSNIFDYKKIEEMTKVLNPLVNNQLKIHLFAMILVN